MAVTHAPITALPNAGGDVARANAPEGITQTWTIGALLVMSSGTAIEATAPYSGTGSAVGFAEAKGRNLAAAQAPTSLSIPTYNFEPAYYIPCTPDMTFIGSLDTHGSLGRLLLATDVGTTVGLDKETSEDVWYLNTSADTTVAYITELVDPVGTPAGRVKFKMLLTTTVTAYA